MRSQTSQLNGEQIRWKSHNENESYYFLTGQFCSIALILHKGLVKHVTNGHLFLVPGKYLKCSRWHAAVTWMWLNHIKQKDIRQELKAMVRTNKMFWFYKLLLLLFNSNYKIITIYTGKVTERLASNCGLLFLPIKGKKIVRY